MLLGSADAVPPAAKIDSRVFAGVAEGERAKFLVVFRDRADLSGAAAVGDRVARRRFVYEALRANAEASQISVRKKLERAGVPFQPHFLVNMIEVEASAAVARELAASEDVAAIENNRPARLKLPKAARELKREAVGGIEPNIQKIRAPELWARGFTGQGVVIGIADTGVQWDHPALKRQYRGWDGSAVSHAYNWHDAVHHAASGSGNYCGSDPEIPCDDYPHGTSVAGLALGDDGAGNQIGVAPGARWIACRNMDHGTGTPAWYTECFEWLLVPTDPNGANPRPDLGADVINNSWLCLASEGCTDPDILRSVVENVRAAGVEVVAAAGNDGFACGNIIDAPAIFAASFTVGATDNDNGYSGFSSTGPVTIDGSFRPKPDLCAPGVNVRTATIINSYDPSFTGTSASTPQVSGAIALLWSAAPALAGNIDETDRLLEEGAFPLTSPLLQHVYPTPQELDHFCGGQSGLDIPNPIFGWGRLDIEGAYEAIFVAPLTPREAPFLPMRPSRRISVVAPRN